LMVWGWIPLLPLLTQLRLLMVVSHNQRRRR
jgi:hypothetical protein